MIDHCISALKHNVQELSYKIYVTDSLQHIIGNSIRWYDAAIAQNNNEPVKTAKEVRKSILAKF